MAFAMHMLRVGRRREEEGNEETWTLPGAEAQHLSRLGGGLSRSDLSFVSKYIHKRFVSRVPAGSKELLFLACNARRCQREIQLVERFRPHWSRDSPCETVVKPNGIVERMGSNLICQVPKECWAEGCTDEKVVHA